MEKYCASAQQRGEFLENLAMFFISTGTPFNRVDNVHLAKACSAVGIALPSRKTFSEVYVNMLYDRTKTKVDGELNSNPIKALGVQIAADGWKKRAANQGEPLINILALKPNGGSIFLGIVRAAGVVKNAAWIASTLEREALAAVRGRPGKMLGVIVDNTAANLAALRQLEEKYPTMVNLGCAAHALSLLIKDMAKLKDGKSHTPGVAKVLSNANDISNAVNDSEVLRAEVHRQQREVMAKEYAIDVHSPTRFAGIVMVLESVLRSRPALKALVVSDEWEELVAGHASWKTVFEGVAKDSWLASAQAVLTLLKPVSDAIHQLEGDHPQLSQLLPIWNKLIAHVKEWARTNRAALASKVVARWEERFQRHYHDAWAAAHLLDPAFAVEEGAAGWRLPFSALTDAQQEGAEALIKRLAVAKAQAAAEEAEAAAVVAAAAVEKAKTAEAKAAATSAADLATANAAAAASFAAAAPQAVADELLNVKLGKLPPGMANAVQLLASREQVGDKVVLKPITMRRNWWEVTGKKDFPHLTAVAVQLLSLHTTTCAAERNWSAWGLLYTKLRSQLDIDRAAKMIFIKGNNDTSARGEDEEVMLSTL